MGVIYLHVPESRSICMIRASSLVIVLAENIVVSSFDDTEENILLYFLDMMLLIIWLRCKVYISTEYNWKLKEHNSPHHAYYFFILNLLSILCGGLQLA